MTHLIDSTKSWKIRWVNLWHATPARTRSEYWWRCLIAYTIQPPTIALWIALVVTTRALCAFFSLIVARRGIQFTAIMHPFSCSTLDVVDLSDTYKYWSWKNCFLMTDTKERRG